MVTVVKLVNHKRFCVVSLMKIIFLKKCYGQKVRKVIVIYPIH